MAMVDPVVELANRYKSEFEESFESLRRRTLSLQEDVTNKVQCRINDLQPVINQQKDELINSLQDQSPASGLDTTKIMETFTWTGILLLGATIGGILGGVVLSGLIGLFVSGFYASVLAYIVLPISAYYYLNKNQELGKENDTILRHQLLTYSFVEGILHGFVLSQRGFAGFPPFAALTPFVIGITAQVAAPQIGEDRIKLLGITLGSGFAAHIALGLVLGLSFPYFILAALYTAIGFVTLQLYLKNVTKETVFTNLYQLSFLTAIVSTQLLVYGILGGNLEDMGSEI